MAMSKLQTSSCNYKGVGQESLNSSLTFENHCKSHTPFLNFYCLTTAIDFYPCLWHYSELPTLSPATIPVAAALPPGHTWGNAVVCVLWWDGTWASRVTWPIYLSLCTAAHHHFWAAHLLPSVPLSLWVWSYFSSQSSSMLVSSQADSFSVAFRSYI